MNGPLRLLLVLFLLQIGNLSCSPAASLDPFPLGTIGCLVSDVCQRGEICANDLLFGSCQDVFSRVLRPESKYQLETDQIERLEDEIDRLIRAGFTWKDAYTQCTLQHTLLEFSRGHAFNRKLCERALVASDWSGEINDEIARVLLQILEDKADEPSLRAAVLEQADREADYLDSHKRDEIVQVHKYFDKSTGQLKRDPFFDLYRSQPQAPSLYVQRDLEDGSSREETAEQSEVPYDRDSGDPLADLSRARDLVSFRPVLPLSLKPEDTAEPQVAAATTKPGLKDIIENLVLTPEDEVLLEGLLEGKISPEDLDLSQQKRLQIFVKGLIQVLGNEEGADLSTVDQENSQSQQDVVEATDRADLEPDIPLDGDVRASQLTANQWPASVQSDDQLDLAVDKKTLNVEPNTSSDDSHEIKAVDSHSVYLELSQIVNASMASIFVDSLRDILKLPPGLVQLDSVGPGHMIRLLVNNVEGGKWDAEDIAKQAQSVNSQLEKTTGLRVDGAGVGRDDNRVEVKQDNRYVVLTFALVGSIAAVVLVVVTIYLCQRHARSRHKLAQITGQGQGPEASKDYQGKCSEKPEPLHAASRIGSVSESQVRSPSSRSSTSSWSEEPAATNMDISTGHIVLSYMEDHLKNQDRLDQEWEAVSGYMAEPCSTKVATDQSNMRKNRFADILPYDHSRVQLSSSVNVSNSDYVNASFITDHDPRNPAYIATQGPLPHTVADFWQMIWEQGSVVIVMLTRLVENGTSLCHRYWPEEGSDLYHIYEVHLVSEHIWCDDYLVRSFYLKNLQTNETRTVTQFHFLTWPELSVPASIKALLDFRRKVNKSFRGRSCPIVVHCSDGCGRTGTYCLIDMVLNKMAKGTKEIDMAATLEHIRDQRMSMVKTKEQFQFSLAAVAEEVHAILKALPQ